MKEAICALLVHVALELNLKGKPPIKTLQFKNFATNDILECQLRFKICHHPLLELCIFHSSSALDDSHQRDSTEQLYKRLVVTSKNNF